MKSHKSPKIEWVHYGLLGTIHYSDGRSVLVQGDDAYRLRRDLDKCRNVQQMRRVLESFTECAK